MQVLALLADGRWHAGPQLADALGISRAAISKQVHRARELGLQIQSVQGRGYRMPQGFEPLQADAIRQALSENARTHMPEIQVLPTVDSTNNHLMQASASPLACFAEHQSGGRGRRGRQWVSPYGSNLYFSVAWSYAQTPPALGALSLAVGVELADVLRDHGAQARLKWPNDLYLDGRKLGGILIEHRGELAGGARIVVGAGLNLRMDQQQASAIDQPWTALGEHIETPPRNLLAAQCLDALLRALQGFQSQGFAPYRRRWQALDLAYEQAVVIDMGNEKIQGRATGVAADGALVVDCGGSLRRFYAGELSLRLAR